MCKGAVLMYFPKISSLTYQEKRKQKTQTMKGKKELKEDASLEWQFYIIL